MRSLGAATLRRRDGDGYGRDVGRMTSAESA